MLDSARQSVSPELFGRMVGVAISAGQKHPPSVQSEQDPPADPYLQAAVAVREALAEQAELFDAVMNRFSALMDLFNNRRLGDWVRASPHNPNAQDIHPAVIHAAAQFKLKTNGRFPVDRFLEAVEEYAEQYPAWTELET